MGVVGEQLGVGDGLCLTERHLEPRPRVEVVELDRLEPFGCTRVDHRRDVLGGRGALRRCTQVDEVLPLPVRVVAEVRQNELGRPLRPLVRARPTSASSGWVWKALT